MNPLLSTPTTTSMFLPANGLTMASMVERKPPRSRKSGVISKKLMPALGKSGTNRIFDFNESIAVGSPRHREGAETAGRRSLGGFHLRDASARWSAAQGLLESKHGLEVA